MGSDQALPAVSRCPPTGLARGWGFAIIRPCIWLISPPRFPQLRAAGCRVRAGFSTVLGDNAQGKTNLLEAIYLLATVRSFRGVGSASTGPAWPTRLFVGAAGGGSGRARAEGLLVRHRAQAEPRRPAGAAADGLLRQLRAVVFCTEDVQLVKARPGSPPLSRPAPRPDAVGYLPLLQRYTQALRSRNALLRRRIVDPVALEASRASWSRWATT